MNERSNITYDHDQAGAVILVASDKAAAKRAEAGFEQAGVAVAASHLIGDVGVEQLRGGPIWLELGEDRGKPLDHWLMAFNAMVEGSLVPASAAVTPPLLDAVYARLDGNVDMAIAPSPEERVTSIAMLMARAGVIEQIGSERRSTDEDARRLRELSEEVSRIAQTLSRMSTSERGEGFGFDPAAGKRQQTDASAPVPEGVPDIDVEQVRATIRARRLREKYFKADYFADPAWDMLLDLFAADISQHRVPVSSLCIAAAVPPTTALRWMKTLTDEGVFRRRADPHDGRRVFVELAPDASLAMRRYFAEMGERIAA